MTVTVIVAVIVSGVSDVVNGALLDVAVARGVFVGLCAARLVDVGVGFLVVGDSL